jgi:hypothetical protein
MKFDPSAHQPSLRNPRREDAKDRYVILSPHTREECLRALDEILANGPDALARYEWGCMDGDHTGYAIVEAGSKGEAAATVPAFLRGKARVVKLNRFTQEQIREFHKKTA